MIERGAAGEDGAHRRMASPGNPKPSKRVHAASTGIDLTSQSASAALSLTQPSLLPSLYIHRALIAKEAEAEIGPSALEPVSRCFVHRFE